MLSMIKKTGSSSGNHQFNPAPNQACAACKHQRRKCTPECPLAPFFPPEHTRRFQAAHKIYGVSNILKILNSLDTFEDKQGAVNTLCWEAEWRNTDPVSGCYGFYKNELQKQRDSFQKELQKKQMELDYYKKLLHSQYAIGGGVGLVGRSQEEEQQHFIQSFSDYSSAQMSQNNPSLHSSEDQASLYPMSSSMALVQAQTSPPDYYHSYIQEVSGGSKVDSLAGPCGLHNIIRGAQRADVLVPQDQQYMMRDTNTTVIVDTQSMLEGKPIKEGKQECPPHVVDKSKGSIV